MQVYSVRSAAIARASNSELHDLRDHALRRCTYAHGRYALKNLSNATYRQLGWNRSVTLLSPTRSAGHSTKKVFTMPLSLSSKPLRANIDETESTATITEQGGQENHRERREGSSSFCTQFA